VASLFAVAESAGPAGGWLLHQARFVERLCWLVLFFFWLSSWLSGKRPVKRSQSLASRVAQILLCLIGIAALALTKLIPLPEYDHRILPRSDALTATASFLTLAGTGLAIWARVMLGTFWSARVTLKEGHELIQSGPYRFVRNPLYLGLLIALLGTALMRCSPRSLASVGIFLGVFLWRMRIERRFLTDQFGAKYADYRRRVKGLVPFVI
jgi:protein-S-isoprenylcysteine O-methyltransferase Ste14